MGQIIWTLGGPNGMSWPQAREKLINTNAVMMRMGEWKHPGPVYFHNAKGHYRYMDSHKYVDFLQSDLLSCDWIIIGEYDEAADETASGS